MFCMRLYMNYLSRAIIFNLFDLLSEIVARHEEINYSFTATVMVTTEVLQKEIGFKTRGHLR